MSNKWIGGLKYTYLGNLKALETKEGFKPVKEMMHDLWHELHSLRLQTRADKILIESIGKEMDERQDEVKCLRAELRGLKRKYAWVEMPCTRQSYETDVVPLSVQADRLFHRGGFVGSVEAGLVGVQLFGDLPLSSIGRAMGAAAIPSDALRPVPPFPKLGDVTVDLLSIAPDLKKK